MSGMIQTVGSQFSGINYQGISKFCVEWTGRAIDFCKTIPNRVGPENLKIGGAFVLTNVFCYLLTSLFIAKLEQRYQTHDKVSGNLTDRQISLKQGVLNGVIPVTLAVIFNVALAKVIKHELSLIGLLGITATAVIIRHLLNRPKPPAAETPPAGTPAAETLPAGTPAAEIPPAGEIPGGTLAAGTLPAGTPAAEIPPAGEIPGGTLPAGTPAAEIPPAGEIPGGTLAGETPPAEIPAPETTPTGTPAPETTPAGN